MSKVWSVVLRRVPILEIGRCSSHFVDGIHFKREERVRFCGRCYDQVIKILKAEGYKLENSIKEENTRSRRLSSSSSEE